MLGNSRWHGDESSPQLVRPAVAAATTPGSKPHPAMVGPCGSCMCEFICLCVSYQWEAVGDFAIRGQLSSETVGRKELVAVVVLDNLTYCFQGHGICIHLVGTHIVKGGGLGGVTLEKETHTTR